MNEFKNYNDLTFPDKQQWKYCLLENRNSEAEPGCRWAAICLDRLGGEEQEWTLKHREGICLLDGSTEQELDN